MLAGGPLHPYAIQSRMKAWGKEQVVNIGQRSNLYKTIERLRDAGLIAVRQTERDQRFPERTIYELTPDGFRQATVWLDDMLSAPRNEFPEFPAALSFIFGLTPEAVQAALERRAAALRERLDTLDHELHDESGPPRLFLLETEYLRKVTAAELDWVTSVVDDIRAGTLHFFTYEEMREMARQFTPPE
jgi:DNA-binding PadR family transcriptional regulator